MLVFAGVAAAGAVVGSIGLLWEKGLKWLVHHEVLLAASEHPDVTIPSAHGVGVDYPRLGIAAAVVVAVLAVVGSAAQSRMHRAEEEL